MERPKLRRPWQIVVLAGICVIISVGACAPTEATTMPDEPADQAPAAQPSATQPALPSPPVQDQARVADALMLQSAEQESQVRSTVQEVIDSAQAGP